MAHISLAQLLNAGVHFGHQANRWNPKMFPFIYAERRGLHILDLVQTSLLLHEASSFVYLAAQENKKILFVGTTKQMSKLVADAAKSCNSFYVNERWLGGMLTNWNTTITRIERLKLLEKQEEEGLFKILPKKEAVQLTKELNKLNKTLSGIRDMDSPPDILIVIDQKQDLTAIQEAKKLAIPIISVLDTNCDPDLADLPIPANDDSLSSIQLILSTLAQSISEATSFK